MKPRRRHCRDKPSDEVLAFEHERTSAVLPHRLEPELEAAVRAALQTVLCEGWARDVAAESLAQIGEFSFILVALGVSYGLVPAEAQSLVVAVAILSITLHPGLFRVADALSAWIGARRGVAAVLERETVPAFHLPGDFIGKLENHVIIVGSGRVGGPVAIELSRHGVPHVVIEQSHERAEELRSQGISVVPGDATRPEILGNLHLERARLVLIAAPDAYQARATLALVKQLNPKVAVVVRTHGDEERVWLEQHGADYAMVGEHELAVSMTRFALRHLEIHHDMVDVAERILGPRLATRTS